MFLRRLLPALFGILLATAAAAAPCPPGIAALALPWAAAAEPGDVVSDRVRVMVESRGRSLPFSVEVAATAEQRQRGLMFRDSLPADGGMLFVSPEERVVHMWMKNTLIPLDMLFLGPDGRILKVAAMAEPGSTEILSSGVPAKGVLELPGGTAARLGITEGDRVVHPAFAP